MIESVVFFGVLAAGYALTFRTRRVGGIRFWRVGRIGGSFYVSKGRV